MSFSENKGFFESRYFFNTLTNLSYHTFITSVTRSKLNSRHGSFVQCFEETQGAKVIDEGSAEQEMSK